MKIAPPLALGSFLILIVSNLQAAGSGWSAPTAVSLTGNPDPTRGAQTNTLAVNSSGLAVAAWDQYFYTNGGGSTIGVNVETNGRWGTPMTLSDPTKYCDRASAKVGGDGTIVAAWACQEVNSNVRTIQAAVRPAGSTQWSTLDAPLATGSIRVSPDPSNVRVAMNATGETWVAWSIFDGAHYVVQAAYRPAGAGTSFGMPMTVSVAGEDAIQPSLALNDAGVVAIAWAGSPWNMSTSPNTITLAKSSNGGVSFTQATVAPDLSRYTGYQNNPAVCLDQSGLAKVMWMGTGLQANWETAPESWASLQPGSQSPTIIQAGNNVSSYISPSLACDSQGNAIASVVIFDATVGVQRAQLWASAFDATTAAWSTQAKLTGNNPRKIEDIATASASLSPDGSAAYIAYIDHYNGVVKVTHLGTSGWGTPYTLGKTSNVSSFAEVVNGAAAAGSQARVLWKTQGGAVHMATEWRP